MEIFTTIIGGVTMTIFILGKIVGYIALLIMTFVLGRLCRRMMGL